MAPPLPAQIQLGGPAPSEADRADFQHAAVDAMGRYWHRIALGAALAALAWWPTDALLYADRPEIRRAFDAWRAGVIGVVLVASLVVPRSPSVLPRVEVGLGLGIAALVGWIGWCLHLPEGQIDDLFPFMYLSPVFTVPMLVPLDRRIGWATLSAAAAWIGAHPAVVPATPQSWEQLSFMLFSVALDVGVGHLIYHLVLGQYVLQRRLAAREAELEELSAGLESRVSEQATLLLDLNGQAASARQRERERLARDLHDGLGQELTGTRLVAGAMLAGPLPEPVQAGLKDLVDLLGRSTSSLRRALHDLAPEALEEHGLVVAIRGMLDETAARAHLRAHARLEPLSRALPAPVAVAAFRVAQEALSNVAQHARAREVEVGLWHDDEALHLEIIDDGVGLQERPAEGRSRFGLQGIRARVIALGGEVKIEGGAGTRVTVKIPLEEPS